MRRPSYLSAILLALALSGCGGDADTSPGAPRGPFQPADHITVDHILIGVQNPKNLRGRYSESDARKLAYDLLAELKSGGDWEKLKKEHSEDPPPGGPYDMANYGVQPTHVEEATRDRMVPGFGDVGFSLRVGEMGVADFDTNKSWHGFHIIKRVK